MVNGTPWVIGNDGKIQVTYLDQELLFRRGYFAATNDHHIQRWVPNETGDYLAATTSNLQILVIHFPLSQEEMARIQSKYEGQFGGF